MTREEAANFIEGWKRAIQERGDSEASIHCMAMTMAIEALRQDERPKGQWIPCSERLPKIGQKCVITIHRNCVYLVVSATYWTGWWWRNGEKVIKKDVTAWMPLPEPYKEGEEE